MTKNYARNWLFEKFKCIAVLGALLVAGSASAQLSGTYTINSGAATSGSNYASFTAFASAINSGGVSGSVTVNVASGSGPYNEQIALTASGTATNTVTINGNGNTITNSGTYVIALNGSDYFTFDNLNVTSTCSGTGTRCYWIYNNADNNTIKNSALRILNYTSTSNSTAYVAFSASATSRSAGDHGSDNVIDNNTMSSNSTSGTGPYSGIMDFRSSSYKTKGNTFTNNTIRDVYYGHFYIYYTDGFTITNNTLTAFRSDVTSGTQYPAYLYYCGGTYQCKFNNNTITGLGGYYQYGVYVYQCSGTSTSPTQINDNSFTSNSSGYYFYGPRVEYCNFAELKNNTIEGNSALSYCYGIYTSSNNDIIIQDNTIKSNSGDYVYPMYNYSNNRSNITIDRNKIIDNDAEYYFYNYMVYYGDNVICTNNIIAGNSAYYFCYNFCYYPTSGVYAHNTIVQDQATQYYNYGLYAYFNAATDFKISNNIFVVGGTSGYGYSHNALYAGGTMTNVSFSNNVWHETSNCTYQNGSTSATSATAYVATSAETGSVAINPNFVNLAAFNVLPTNPAISNMGLQGLAALDHNKATRTACGPDPGAYEFTVDHSVTAISTLPATECGNYQEEVKVRFNNGTAVAMTDVEMFYQVNGDAPVVETISSASASTYTDFTFTKKAVFNKPGMNTLRIGLGCDDNTSNNVITQTVSITSSPYGGELAMGSQFDGYFNDGTVGNPDVTVKDYISDYDISRPAVYTAAAPGVDYTYALKAWDGGTDVTSQGFTLASNAEVFSADPAVALAGKTIFMELTVTDLGTTCDTSFGRWMYVPHTPVASFTASDICLGDVAQFKNTSTLGGPNYMITAWEFDDPDPAVTDDNSDIKDGFWEYSAYGAGVVVEMTVANGVYPKFEYTATRTINVTPKPVIDFKVLNACEGSPITVINSTSISTGSAITYSWDFGGEYTSTAQVPSYTFATPGQRKITVTATSNGCNASLTKNAYQFEMPVANFTSVGECNFVDVEFTSTSTIANEANMGYSWDFAGSGISRVKNPLYTFATAGTKTVILTATSEFGCANSTTKTIVLNESPEADFSWDAACNLTPINFTFTGSVPNGGKNSSYSWDFAGQATAGQPAPSYLFSKVGAKEVTLTVADLNGCSSSITKEVNVVLQAVAGFSAKGFEATDVCEGDKAVFTNTSTVAAGNLSYSWNFGDNTPVSTDHSPTHTYTSPGVYSVTLNALVAGGCSDDITVQVEVNEAPDASFTVTREGRTIKLDGPAGNDKYRWTFGDGARDITEDPTYTYNNIDNGTFEVCLATEKGVCKSRECEDVTINLAGISELTQNNDMINVYPNPSNGKFNVTVENAGDVVIVVGDILGNVLNVEVRDNLNGTYNVDMSAVANGVYFVQVKNGDFYATKRITVSK